MYIKKASPWKRIGAYVLDSIILSIIFSVCMFISWGLYLIVAIFGSFLYYGICEGSSLQGSPGKRMCGLMVVDERGYPLTYSKSFVRSLCRLLSGLTLGIGFLIGLFQENGKALHDQLAHTGVIDRQPIVAPAPSDYPMVVCLRSLERQKLSHRRAGLDGYRKGSGFLCSRFSPAQRGCQQTALPCSVRSPQADVPAV